VILAAGLIASRLVHYAALMILFGAACFPVYTYRRLPPYPAEAAALMAWLRRVLFAAGIAALLSGILWLGFVTATMSGSLAGMLDADNLLLVVRGTGFGRIWLVRLILIALSLVLIPSERVSAVQGLLFLAVAAVALGSIAGTGHAGADSGPGGLLHIASDGAHLLAAGVWIGGLCALGFALRREASGPAAEKILLRFSGVGYVAVAVIVASGIANSWFLVGTFAGLITTPYGQALMVKLALFFGMAGLAATNRFWIVPGLAGTAKNGSAAIWLVRIRRHVALEQALGFLILAAVSVLGTMPPALQH